MTYQSKADEVAITQRHSDDHTSSKESDNPNFVDNVVELVRATRQHSEIRVGSSVRGAVDLVLLAGELSRLRGIDAADRQVGLDAALTALSGRIRMQESSQSTPEQIITELWDKIMAVPDEESDNADDGSTSGKL